MTEPRATLARVATQGHASKSGVRLPEIRVLPRLELQRRTRPIRRRGLGRRAGFTVSRTASRAPSPRRRGARLRRTPARSRAAAASVLAASAAKSVGGEREPERAEPATEESPSQEEE